MQNELTYTSGKITIGKLQLGGGLPVRIQSMTNTDTLDTSSTVNQCIKLANAGCEMIRLAVPSVKSAENLIRIRKLLHQSGYDLPLIADVHFNPQVAEIAAKIVEKVRINPGNYCSDKKQSEYTDEESSKEVENIYQNLKPLLKICKEYGTALRIGVNHGSLSKRILFHYGNTPEGMVESAMEFARICKDFGFDKLVLSLKSSNVPVMILANRLLVKTLAAERMNFPIHLGVTEAGNAEEGRIKSAIGIGTLLRSGIGDTIRVSLTEDPVSELPVAKKIISISAGKSVINHNYFILESKEDIRQPLVISGLKTSKADLIIDESGDFREKGYRLSPLIDFNNVALTPNKTILVKAYYKNIIAEDFIIKSGIDLADQLLSGYCKAIWFETDDSISNEICINTAKNILQALGLRYSKAEFISCPSCGRTMFDIENALEEVKNATHHLAGLKIAVMGCIVNGPGEMADADYGYVGAGKGKVTLYKGNNIMLSNVEEFNAVNELVKLIKANGDWQSP